MTFRNNKNCSKKKLGLLCVCVSVGVCVKVCELCDCVLCDCVLCVCVTVCICACVGVLCMRRCMYLCVMIYIRYMNIYFSTNTIIYITI